MASIRKDRVADQIRDLLAQNFYGGRLSDPRLESVTITAVKVTADLQLASVYFRVYDETHKESARTGLQACAPKLRHSLRELDLRRLPNLRFFYDESLENAAKIESLLLKIRE